MMQGFQIGGTSVLWKSHPEPALSPMPHTSFKIYAIHNIIPHSPQPIASQRLECSRASDVDGTLMPGRLTTHDVQLDAPTSRAIANGIGERLRQALGTETPFPDKLQKLLDAMRNREADDSEPTGKVS